eukprot:CAMPEP_0179094936 /NCGR_PEP_ID=MMETSP0796-20121207/43564_1 /TAXON_ID=73915 /ORGANISM="Pyrodinium bahamense, Strain pbaha01" /LENGTH=77 /DNA_ID=CAMNT_0020792617 /DNA_START=243 /DNA_END=473 /DNA_ORIENTATION=-
MEARTLTENGIVDHDAVDVGVRVGLLQLLLELELVNFPQLEAQLVCCEGLARPLSVFPRGRVTIGKKAHELRAQASL